MIKLFFLNLLATVWGGTVQESALQATFFFSQINAWAFCSVRVVVECLVLPSEGECVFRKEAEQPPPFDHQQQWWWLGLQLEQSLWFLTSVWSGSYQGQRFTVWFICLFDYVVWFCMDDLSYNHWNRVSMYVSVCIAWSLKGTSQVSLFSPQIKFSSKWMNILTSLNFSNHVGLKLVLWCNKIRIRRLTTDFHLGSWSYGRGYGSIAQIPTSHSIFWFLILPPMQDSNVNVLCIFAFIFTW